MFMLIFFFLRYTVFDFQDSIMKYFTKYISDQFKIDSFQIYFIIKQVFLFHIIVPIYTIHFYPSTLNYFLSDPCLKVN